MSLNSISNSNFYTTMQGSPTMLASPVREGTYSRIYQKFRPCDIARANLENATIEDYKKLGEKYTVTPRPPTDTNGGFFRTLREDLEEAQLPIEYALSQFSSQFSSQFESLTGLPAETMIKQYKAFGIDYILHHYFDSVVEPQDGNLVIYLFKHPFIPGEECRHAGIYRINLSSRGIVESKTDSCLFQHDFFYLPDTAGNRAKCYRIKQRLELENHPAVPDEAMLADTKIENNGFAFVASEANTKIRKELDNFKSYPWFISTVSPKIKYLNYIKFTGPCYDYAFAQVFKTYTSIAGIGLHGVNNTHILDHCFTVTTQPQKGDLVVYYDSSGFPVHYGIFISPSVIESKWGATAVFQHPPFYMDNDSHFIKCFHLNGDPETSLQSLREAYQNRKI